MTSITLFFHPREIFAGASIDTNKLADFYKRRNLYDKTRLECFAEGTEPRDFSPEERDQDEADFFKEEFDPLDASPLAGDLEGDSP